MKILAVECSATPASCAVCEDGKVLAASFVNVKLTHSQSLMPMIEATIKSANIDIGQIEGFAVSAGPGSFTGIRIGISAVKGLAAPKNTQCSGVSTLLSMAHCLKGTDHIVCAVMDARCNQVYGALFLVQGGTVSRLSEDEALMAAEFADRLRVVRGQHSLPITVMGDGALMFYEFVKDIDNVTLADEFTRYQDARGVYGAALELFEKGDTVSPDKLLPFYLRLPQAERELIKKRGQ